MSAGSFAATLPNLAEVASGYAVTVIDAVRLEYPNSLRHVMTGPDDLITPRGAHPAFYGCFDWHSSVEMHWALVRMLRSVPEAVPADRIRQVLGEHLTAEALDAEADYLATHPGWERPYGYGWVLALAAELEGWDDPDAAVWSVNIRPLADVVAGALVHWLPRLPYPDRGGMHSNSAFALARTLPWARARTAAGDSTLLEAIGAAAARWFGTDADYPAGWEPSGTDFLSGALTEAELVSALLSAEDFPVWLERFLPGLAEGEPGPLLTPAVVTDPQDGQGAHLHGLNLYRAYAFGLLAARLPSGDARVPVLQDARDRHAAASLPAVVGEGWMVEHWLACYAVLLLS